MNRLRTLIPWVKQKNLLSSTIDRASGCYFYEKNKQIVDFTSGLMVVNLGHNNEYIYDGFKNHMNSGIGYLSSQFSTYEREKLSDRLLNISKFKNGKVFYTNAGADANESAMFFALESNFFKNKNKKRTLAFEKSYHGGSSVITSLISGDNRRERKELFYNSKLLKVEPIISNPEMKDQGKKSLLELENEFKKNNVSSILFEGSSGSAGLFLYPDNYLKKVRELCDKYDVVFICDEVMSGFGRTGSVFAHQNKNQDVIPDIITCAKGLTSGYVPLGAVIINNNISNVFEDNIVYQGLTYSGHTLACNIANRCLDLYLYNDREIINNVFNKSITMNNLGQQFKNNNQFIKDYRTNGLLGGFELDLDKIKLNQIDKLKNNLYQENIYCYIRNNYIFTAPPLLISNDLIMDTMFKINKCIYNTLNNK